MGHVISLLKLLKKEAILFPETFVSTVFCVLCIIEISAALFPSMNMTLVTLRDLVQWSCDVGESISYPV